MHSVPYYKFISTLFFLICLTRATFALTLGDNTQAITAALGNPHKVSRGPTYITWFYDDAYLQLVHGKIIAYNNASRLQIKIYPKQRKIVDRLNMQSTKDDILSLLGTPNSIDVALTFERWWYGDEYIRFVDNHIQHFTNAAPLRFRLTPKPFIHKKYSDALLSNDLLKKYGSPDSVTLGLKRDTWRYGSNFYFLEDDHVVISENRNPRWINQESPLYKRKFENTDIYPNIKYKNKNQDAGKSIPQKGGIDDSYNEQKSSENFF